MDDFDPLPGRIRYYESKGYSHGDAVTMAHDDFEDEEDWDDEDEDDYDYSYWQDTLY